MKANSLEQPIYLNLYNFDSADAQDCPYILTSPRSLEACRKAGYKPVELLHKTVQEYQHDLGTENLNQVYHLYADQEQERLNKLEKCRAIRRELMKQSKTEDFLKENVPSLHCLEVKKKRNIINSISSSTRKDQLDKENILRAREKSVPKNITPKTANNDPNKKDTFTPSSNSPGEHAPPAVLHLTGGAAGSTSASESTNKTAAQWARWDSAQLPKKSFRSRKSYPLPPNFASPLSLRPRSSSSEISTFSSNSSLVSLKKYGKRNIKQGHNKQYTKPGAKAFNKQIFRLNPSLSSTSSQERCRQPPKNITSVIVSKDFDKRYTLHDCGTESGFDSNNNQDFESVTESSLNPHKAKQVSFRYISTDDICIPEHDRRILESMALKKRLEKENDEFAHKAHQLWERDREEREQINNEHVAQWRQIIAEKRKIENLENARRLEEMKQSLRLSQKQLERKIQEKEERFLRQHHAVGERKKSDVEERSLVSAKRRAEVEQAQQQMEVEAALWQHTVEKQHRARMEKAESSRLKQRETYRKRVASANRVEELRHQERWQQVQEETTAALNELRRLCHMKEERAQQKHAELLEERERHMKAQSLERAIKYEQVKQLHDELDLGLQKWQEQVLALQWEATQRAENKAARQMEVKRQRIETENKARWHHHTQLMERICKQDEARMRYIRDIIARKEAKMERMAEERDLAIKESRLQAQATADLREHLRRTLSPETFDQKVARVALETRLAGRPPSASPPMTRSHIFLG